MNVLDAVNHYRGEWPQCYINQTDNQDDRYTIRHSSGAGFYPDDVESEDRVCSMSQFNNCVKECEVNFIGLPKINNQIEMQKVVKGRFRENKIVSHLLETYTDMNKIAMMDFSDEDRMQFAQLIGYSVSGYSDLSYVSDESYYAAEARSSEG